jgi:hypothetical protein
VGEVSAVGTMAAESVVPSSSLEDSFLLLARLGCVSALSDSSDSLKAQIDSAIREELRAALSFSQLSKRFVMWLGFEGFAQLLRRDLDASKRDVLLVEFVLSQISIQQLFEQSQSWNRMRTTSSQYLESLVGKLGGADGLSLLLRDSYREQRDSLGKDVFLRSLPTAVLVVSSIIAIAMALVFTRSLTTGL